MGEVLISIRDLTVEYATFKGPVIAVHKASLDVIRNEVLGIVGESGSGKSTLANAIMRVLPPQARISGGSILYRGVDLAGLGEGELRKIRWKRISIVPQAALNTLNPTLKIVDHFVETARAHNMKDRKWAVERASELLDLVRLEPRRVLKSYPHELSGGMKQRVLIALSLLLNPEVLILDEPTTALDVLTQRIILDLLKSVRRKLGLTMIFITHDISIVADLADRVAVMYAGEVMEVGGVEDVFYRPHHPYTKLLIKSVPSLREDVSHLRPIPGSPPDPFNMPGGCKFHPRCPWVMGVCASEEPPNIYLEGGGLVRCHLYSGGTK